MRFAAQPLGITLRERILHCRYPARSVREKRGNDLRERVAQTRLQRGERGRIDSGRSRRCRAGRRRT